MTEFQKKYRGLLGDGEDGYIDYDGIQSLIEENEKLKKELAHYKDNCTAVWMPQDVLCIDDTLTDEQVSWILETMQHKHDANLGITWETIEFWVEEVKKND